MNDTRITAYVPLPEEARQKDSTTVFGFWVYLMTDFVLFASLFAIYAVLRNNIFGGPSGAELFSMPFALAETFILLTSSFAAGLSLLAARDNHKGRVLFWLLVTSLLGLLFVSLEFSEFLRFITMGDSWQRSGFLSAYFLLVGTHGLHIIAGLVWMVSLMIAIAKQKGSATLSRANTRKLTLLVLFWHFLDLIWIFIFTIVYLLAVVWK